MHHPDDPLTRMVNDLSTGGTPSCDHPGVRELYDDLKRLAHHRLAGESHRSFDTTEFVHEAYVKLYRAGSGAWQSRAHFFGSVARAMEQLLIDAARRRRAALVRIDDQDVPGAVPVSPIDLSEALGDLEREHPGFAELARLKIFTDSSIPVIAELLGISENVVSKRWRFVRTWLWKRVSDNRSLRRSSPADAGS